MNEIKYPHYLVVWGPELEDTEFFETRTEAEDYALARKIPVQVFEIIGKKERERHIMSVTPNKQQPNEPPRVVRIDRPKVISPIDAALELLAVSRDTTAADLKKAFRTKAKQVHPDVGGTLEEFLNVEGAYRYLRRELGFPDV